MTDLEQKLNSGKVYQVIAQENQDPRFYEYLEKMEKYNTLGYTERAEKEKQQILKELFAEIGNNSYIQAPYHAMWGGRHVHLGKNVYINFNCTFVDDAQVYIGDDTLIASNVTILPGVTIGDNSVIGACSVVTKDIPANVVAMGTPAKVVREITPDDDIYYDHGKLIAENMA